MKLDIQECHEFVRKKLNERGSKPFEFEQAVRSDDSSISGEYKKDGNAYSNNKGLGKSLKSTLEKYKFLQQILLILAFIGTCMVIGDEVLTPALQLLCVLL